MTAITQKTKDEFLKEVEESFEKTWKAYRDAMTDKIGRHTYASFLDLIGRIQECRHKEQAYFNLFKETPVGVSQMTHDLYIPQESDNFDREYNNFFDMLYYAFEQGNCNMVHLIAEEEVRFMDEYIVSTKELYSMDWKEFKSQILSRSASPKTFVNAEFREIRTEDCWRLLSIISEDDNYVESPFTEKSYWLKRDIIKYFYEDLKKGRNDEFHRFNFKFKKI